METIRLHYLLRYHLEQNQRAPIHWDMHNPPTSARYHFPRMLPIAALSSEDLEMPATEPSVISLRIICDVYSYDSPIVARNFSGVTVHDVLFAIYKTLQIQINPTEWSDFRPKQQGRIKHVFEGRRQRLEDPSAASSASVKGIDTLLYHTLFGGLTPIPSPEPTCVLTLRRAQPAPA
ncbi:hypothetical protein AX14_008826 [Amanita brunnescens Koide BX004]|nr:hypothetical protein AX14_008826 [Amanita brunnescens Koide BX004]